MKILRRKTCRACGSSSLKKVIDLGGQYPQGAFLKEGHLSPLRRIPTSVVLCASEDTPCGLLQLEYTTPQEILYSDYWYCSGTNRTMKNHLAEIVRDVTELIKPQPMNRVLDIGCNDGTLLNCYSDSVAKYGIDPSSIDISSEDIHYIHDIFPSGKLDRLVTTKKFDVITSIAMFYDLEEPIKFVSGVKKLLSEGGVWCFEVSYMPTMIEKLSYDTICHEHLEYYSLMPLEYIMKQAGMKIFNATFNNINGGSIRCYATHEDNHIYDSIEFSENLKRIRYQEFNSLWDIERPYEIFQSKIKNHAIELSKLIRSLKEQGKRIHIYGASTKGNTLLQFCHIDNTLIDFAAERNPKKFGAITIGSNIPIISEEESRKMNPDYYLVLPWHFKDEFLEREQEALGKGVGFIFPLPKIEIVKR